MVLAMNDNEKDRIAAAINALRPDWPVASIRTILDSPKLTHRTRRDAAVALAWVACESVSKTPARVNEAGPWWHAANIEGDMVPRLSREERRKRTCNECGRLDGCADSCPGFVPLDQGRRERTAAPVGLRMSLRGKA